MQKQLLIFLLCFCPFLSAQEKPQTKNVLFIVVDDLRADVLGCYGDQVCQTPNIDRLAKNGMLFTHAYSQGVWCAPSRQSFMFGRYKKRQGQISLAQHFRQNGIHSARVSKIYHMRVPGDIVAGTNGPDHAESWDERYNVKGAEAHTPGDYSLLNKGIFTREMKGRQSTATPNRMFVSVAADSDGSDQPDYRAADKTIELLRKFNKKDKPFFLAFGLVRPHYPSVAPKKYFDMYPLDKITLPERLRGDLEDMPKAGRSGNHEKQNGIDEFPLNQKRMWQGYYASVTFMDQQIGRVLKELKKLGLDKDTTVVFFSDHGYHLGDHDGLWEKSNLHERVTRVPLIISAPGKKSGRTAALAELVDLYPTLSDLAGLSYPKHIDGKSLLPVLDDPKVQLRKSAYSFQGKGKALRSADWAYMNYGRGKEELYDMKRDPQQFHNLAGQAKYLQVLEDFRRQLQEYP